MALSAQQKQVSQHTLCNIKGKEKRTRWFCDAEWFFGAEWQVPRTQPPQLSKWLDTQKHRDTQGYFLGHTRVHTTHPAAAAISSARGARICKCRRSDTFLPHPLYTMGYNSRPTTKQTDEWFRRMGRKLVTGLTTQPARTDKMYGEKQQQMSWGHPNCCSLWPLNLSHTSGFIQKS